MTQPDPPETTTIRGRYRRRPAAWLWPALLVIPLLAALWTWAPRGSETPAAAPSPSTAASTPTAPARWPVEVTGDKSAVTINATVTDAAAKSKLLEAVRQAVPNARVEDRVFVVAGQDGTDAGGLGGVLASAVSTFEDFGVLVTDSGVAIRGTAPDQKALDTVGQAAGQAFPGRQVTTAFTRGVPSPTGALTCDDIAGQIAQRLAAHPVTFDHASADVSAASRERLARIGQGLAGCNSTGIVVRGHTDTTGTPTINEALSARRAEAVRAVLVASGVPADRIRSEGVGAREPVTFDDTEAGRAQNRRVEIRVEGGAR